MDKLREALVARINNYFQMGGVFNPEQMDHIKVQDLLKDCREFLAAPSEPTDKRLSREEKLEQALRGIMEIGKRDMSNPKYDGYFDTAREALAAPSEPQASEQVTSVNSDIALAHSSFIKPQPESVSNEPMMT